MRRGDTGQRRFAQPALDFLQRVSRCHVRFLMDRHFLAGMHDRCVVATTQNADQSAESWQPVSSRIMNIAQLRARTSILRRELPARLRGCKPK